MANNLVTAFIKGLEGLKAADTWMREISKGYDPLDIASQKYADRVEERYNSMRVMGMTRPISLRSIFVRVNILKKITARQRITLEDLEAFFDRDQKGFGQYEQTEAGLEMVNQFQKVIILGKPGCGKTTFLKHIALMALDNELKEQRIPIFIVLKEWADSKLPLMDFIVKQFDICRFPEAQPFVERMLDKGKCLLLLDGFDEVGGDVKVAIQDIRDFSDKYSKNQFILRLHLRVVPSEYPVLLDSF